MEMSKIIIMFTCTSAEFWSPSIFNLEVLYFLWGVGWIRNLILTSLKGLISLSKFSVWADIVLYYWETPVIVQPRLIFFILSSLTLCFPFFYAIHTVVSFLPSFLPLPCLTYFNFNNNEKLKPCCVQRYSKFFVTHMTAYKSCLMGAALIKFNILPSRIITKSRSAPAGINKHASKRETIKAGLGDWSWNCSLGHGSCALYIHIV